MTKDELTHVVKSIYIAGMKEVIKMNECHRLSLEDIKNNKDRYADEFIGLAKNSLWWEVLITTREEDNDKTK